MKGFIQVYTGDGKGKTTAALGLILRAAGAGMKIYLAQFMKGVESSEHNALQKLSSNVTMRQYGSGLFIKDKPTQEEINQARKGLAEARQEMLSGKYQLVVLDEANVAVHHNLISIDALLEFLHAKPIEVELIITGRNAHPAVIEAADLVTEMTEIKHYYQKGVPARTGIEK